MIFTSLISNKRKLGLVLSVLFAACVAASGTFAWFTAQDSVRNRFTTDMVTEGSTTIVETFRPPTEWKPGQEVTKRVAVVNTGSGAVLVRASFEEVMNKLAQPPKAKDAPLSGAEVPQLFNAGAFSAWATPQSLSLAPTPALPQNVEVRIKRIPENPQPGDAISYTFVAWHNIQAGAYQGKAQRVTADFAVSGTALNISHMKYWAYDGKTETEAAWAHFADPKTGATPGAPPTADIGTPKTDAAGKMIHLNYADKQSLTGAAPVAGKWWYNQGDGFFYYIGKVDSGMITPDLLTSLTLDAAADTAYTGLDFDLIVNLEAIQNTKDAITATSGGWNLTPYQTLLTEMQKYCV